MLTKNLGFACLVSMLFTALLTAKCYEDSLIERLDHCTRYMLDRGIIAGLQKTVNPDFKQLELPLTNYGSFPKLFEVFPKLQKTVPYISFCELPTPVIHCDKLSKKFGVKAIIIKDDGKTGKKIGSKKLFGGNKPRKLEFLLGDALSYNADYILARGGVGTNFGLAAATYAQLFGIKSVLALGDEPNSHTVRRNLLLLHAIGAQMRVTPFGICNYTALAMEFFRIKQETGKFPYVLQTGGSCPRGALGFVNAAFELAEQIKAGILPELDYIYAAVGNGSGGSIAGLLLGVQAAGLKSHIVAVHIEPEVKSGEVVADLKNIYHGANELLHQADPSFPLYPFPEKFTEVKEFCGEDYGLFTHESLAARETVYTLAGIELDGTYGGKAFAGMIGMIKKNKLESCNHLFWNGYCPDECKEICDTVNPRDLIHGLQHYFTEPVQLFDRKF